MRASSATALVVAALVAGAGAADAAPRHYEVVAGSGPHDVAASPAPGGPVYYTGQRNGTLGIVDPATGRVEEVKLGARSAPHGVIVGPDGAPWITDSGLNAIVRVDPVTQAVKAWPLHWPSMRASPRSCFRCRS